MAAALSALESGNTGFVGFVKTDQHIDWVTGEIQSVGGDGIQVLDVSGEVRKIDPAQLYWDFDKRRYLTMGLVKHIALHTFLESARYRNLEVTISFNSDNGQTIVVKGKISVLTSTDSEELKKNFLLDTTDGLFNEPAKMSVLLISEQRPYFWAIPLTRIEKVRGPLFRITE